MLTIEDFDHDIASQVVRELRPCEPAFQSLSAVEQAERLRPYIEKQARRDHNRGVFKSAGVRALHV